MRKFSALYRNEVTKVIHKPIFIVLVALTVASMLFTGLVLKLDISASYDNGYRDDEMYESEIENFEENIKNSVEYYKKEVASLQKTLADSYMNEDGTVDIEKYEEEAGQTNYYISQGLPYDIGWQLVRIEYLKILKEYFPEGTQKSMFNIGALSVSQIGSSTRLHFLGDTAERLASIRAYDRYEQILADVYKDAPQAYEYYEYYDFNPVSVGMSPETYSGEKEKLEGILRDADFNVYIDAMADKIKKDETLTEQEKKIKLEGNELLRKAYRPNMSEQAWSELNEKLNLLSNCKIQLDSGKTGNGRNMTDEEIKQLETQISELTLGIGNKAAGFGGNQTEEEMTRVGMIASAGVAIAGIAMILMGGMLIAEEIQTGSIKTLIIAPVKRRKIVGAKFAMLVTFALVESLIIFLTLMLVCAVFGFGFANHVFVFAGVAHLMNPALYYLLYVLLMSAESFFAGCFAFMLSALLRNYGAAIALSMVGTFVLGDTVSLIRLMGEDSLIIKHLYEVLPPANFELQEKLFSTSLETGGIDFLALLTGNFGIKGNSLTVSVIYLAVFITLFVFTAFQSFNKRDIK
ncbi:MAG: ABC transporter permease subunit [Clostridia bacterium]|nr:ABC transporter permease subunit [Clostridia bacterium]